MISVSFPTQLAQQVYAALNGQEILTCLKSFSIITAMYW